MAKDRSAEKAEKKKEKHPVTEDGGVKKSKKDKKDKQSRKSDVSMVDETNVDESTVAADADGDSEMKTSGEVAINGLNKDQLLAAMVPFANPMADEKSMKKVLKSVKKGMQD